MADVLPDANAQVSVESEGRTLTGVGVSEDDLHDVVDREAPATGPAEANVPASADAVPPKPTRGQARFSELTAKAKEAATRAEAAEKKAADLEARLAAPRQEPPAPTRVEPQPAAPQYTRPEPTEDDIGAKYKTYAEFTRDQALWVWEQQQGGIQEHIQRVLAAERAAHAHQAQVDSTRVKGRAAYADFDAILQSGPGAGVQMPMAALQAIYALPNSEHVQYALMKDGGLAQRVAQLAFTDPFAFATEILKLAPPAALPASTGAVSAILPAPVQPVGASSKTTIPSSAEYAHRGNFEAYRDARAAERGESRRK